MTVIEAHGDDASLAPRIAALAAGESLDALAAEREVQRLLQPLLAAHRATIDAIAAPCDHDLAAICARYGDGHARSPRSARSLRRSREPARSPARSLRSWR